ncbi:hypothetical protein HRG_007521 [Hirsutella rhossiliensis]|uniref:N2227-like protein n=1 Tax=Hirsutella rhossiliensis TaxID=111463 RepID=A0A9P8SFZ5_9HYPO|nr:uncharacterized protein HRG_07521 [Hirsutella rhossiliensis]KAH0961443.1 hypothetical protein HRG_07521 [Hirsutella rhossiliensis]
MRVAACVWWLVSGSLPALCLPDDLLTADAAQVGPVTEVHEITLTLQQYNQSTIQRHGEERSRLLGTLDKRNGKWTANHARHRLLDALHGFTRYRERQAAELKRLRGLYKNVSKAQKAFLEHHLSYSSKFTHVEQKLLHNQALCDRVVRHALEFYGIENEELHKHIADTEATGQQADKISVSQALKHIVRDWTDEGDHERSAPFACMLPTLDGLFPARHAAAEKVKILVPGAGLGRLGHDIHRLRGFQVTINEWSMFMNVVYRFIERYGLRDGQTFHPFVDGWSHHTSDSKMQRQLQFPDVDVNPHSVLMMEGDFTTAFRHQEGFYDVVVTYFFIDTARNLIMYFDTIKKILKPGGYWINLGPLLYGTAPFVQLSLQDIVKVAEAMKFEFLETSDECGILTFANSTVRSIEAIYGFDKEALTKNSYNAQFWVAKRL